MESIFQYFAYKWRRFRIRRALESQIKASFKQVKQARKYELTEKDRELCEKLVQRIHEICSNCMAKHLSDELPDFHDRNCCPVRLVGDVLYIDDWCRMYIFKYSEGELYQIHVRRTKLFPDWKKVDAYLMTVLLIFPLHQLYWDTRKVLVKNGVLSFIGEICFTDLILDDKPDSIMTRNYRDWMIAYFSNFSIMNAFAATIFYGSNNAEEHEEFV